VKASPTSRLNRKRTRKQDVLSTVEAEVSSQPALLRKPLQVELLRAPPSSIFIGAGDSLAACQIARRLSSIRHLAMDPYELVADPGVAKGRKVYIVSASGRTVSNIMAAEAVKGIAQERIAVTASVRERLLDATDGAIFIPYKPVARIPGTASFSLSLLTLLKLTNGDFRCRFSRAYSEAERNFGKVMISTKGTTYFLGNGATLPVCFYAALKVHEFLGGQARCLPVEEFGHAPVFALGKGDTVNSFLAQDPLGFGKRLTTRLREKGFKAVALSSWGSNLFEQVFYCVFLSQLAALTAAKSKGLSRPYFVGAREKLAISDYLIY